MSSYILGYHELMNKLNELNTIRLEGIIKKQATQMYQRAAKRGAKGGGTPYKTGELMESRYATKDEFGYTKEYGPHVEYGHRTPFGGFVSGQRFLRNNIEIQEPIFKKDIEKEIERIIDA